MYHETYQTVVQRRLGGKGWGRTDLLGCQETETELNVLFIRKNKSLFINL